MHELRSHAPAPQRWDYAEAADPSAVIPHSQQRQCAAFYTLIQEHGRSVEIYAGCADVLGYPGRIRASRHDVSFVSSIKGAGNLIEVEGRKYSKSVIHTPGV
jgi:hypothetical protein